ncbi:MAG TPA: PAS domain-containing protein [Methyloceanibacter sp.]|nr:PAS domain-containing protein [Methyloceanibacter sp.]
MQQPTSRQLYAYWDRVRNGRVAPRRFEIEPSMIAAVLPETFIVEAAGTLGYRFRLAGTRICEQFGRELRGADFLQLWQEADRDAISSLLRNIFTDAAVGYGRFRASSCTNRQANFELVLLPLIHTGETVNRVLGAITAIDPPFWLGAEPLLRQEILELDMHWPDGKPAFLTQGSGNRRFRVLEGGLGSGRGNN